MSHLADIMARFQSKFFHLEYITPALLQFLTGHPNHFF